MIEGDIVINIEDLFMRDLGDAGVEEIFRRMFMDKQRIPHVTIVQGGRIINE